MFPIPMYMKTEDFQAALRHLAPKPPEKPEPSYIELAKQFTKAVGTATPGQHEEMKFNNIVPDIQYNPAPYRTCFGLGGSGGD